MDVTIPTIIVADDEPLQREGLCHLVQKFSPDSKIISCCNGDEILTVLRQTPVELVITDICMPFTDGIEIARLISENFPGTKIVLISAYQEFRYAQSAIQYGVKEYLIKPFRAAEVEGLLEKIAGLLTAEKEKHRYYQEACAQSEQAATLRLLQKSLRERVSTADSPLAGQAGLLAVLRLHPKLKNAFCRTEAGKTSAALCRDLSSLLPQLKILEDGISSPDEFPGSSLLLFVFQTDEAVVQKALVHYADHFSSGKFDLQIGLSSYKTQLLPCAQEARCEAQQALQNAFYENRHAVYCRADFSDALFDQFASDWKPVLERKLESDDPAAAADYLRARLSQYKGPWPEPAKLKTRFFFLTESMLSETKGMLPQDVYEEKIRLLYRAYLTGCSLEETLDILQESLKWIHRQREKSLSSFDSVQQCILYIQTHFHEDLSLQTLSEQLHFHPNYLSAQIKTATGFSYQQFVLNLRLEHACKLLTESNKQVKDIARECGFRDPSYFSRTFRAREKVTPEMYRKVRRQW